MDRRALPALLPVCQPQAWVPEASGVPLSAWRARGVGVEGHEACRQGDLLGCVLYPWQPLSIHLLGGELAQVLKVFVGLQTCRDKAAMSDSGREVGAGW